MKVDLSLRHLAHQALSFYTEAKNAKFSLKFRPLHSPFSRPGMEMEQIYKV